MLGGLLENRVIELNEEISLSALEAATNYLNAKLSGKTIEEARTHIHDDIKNNQTQLNTLTEKLIMQGLAMPTTSGKENGHIIIRGQSHLLEDVTALEDLERARALLNYLEEHQNMLNLLSTIDEADSVQIFIGAQNQVFDQSGWSMILSPYKDQKKQSIGAIGVIGPTRLNYDRIIPMVDYTSRIMEKIIGKLVDEL